MSFLIGVIKGDREFRIVKIFPPELAEFLYDFYIYQTNPPSMMMQFIEKPYILLIRWCQEPNNVYILCHCEEAFLEEGRRSNPPVMNGQR